jgi:hypothetical protein
MYQFPNGSTLLKIYPVVKQRLVFVFNSIRLLNDNTITYYEIETDLSIYLVLKLRGD